ncbi:MAG: phytoene/squalene synthase family protein [Chlamydiota bacterium]|nr:phytoene/squalene synthase family protein [Chlamydiota bacterium]
MNLEASYQYCSQVAKNEAKNFYYGFLPLPKDKRRGLYALYAFMRHCDDLADDPHQDKKNMLDSWRALTVKALEGHQSDAPQMPALVDCLERFQIPQHYIFELIDGVEMDLHIQRYNTFTDLYQYCYRVASVVGLCCLYIYGFDDPQAKRIAIDCGIAFQLTNILRDIKEDAARNRIYLPLEDLERFGYKEDELMKGVTNDAFIALLSYEVTRAKSYFENGFKLINMVHRDSRSALRTLISIYQKLLEKINKNKGSILQERIQLSQTEKIWILMRSFISKI